MTDAHIYRRPAFPNRPWISGKVYDDYARPSILHCDAYLFVFMGREYLMIDWRAGGFKRVALDGYLIEHDGMTPMWNIEPMYLSGRLAYWTRINHATMSRVHRAMLGQSANMMTLGRGQWARVAVQAHYVHLSETDTEPGAGAFKAYGPRGNGLPDIL